MAQAIVIPETGGSDVLVLEDVTAPVPAAGEVLIRNHAGAVNFIDTIIRRGEMPECIVPELPHMPGVEDAGVVEAIGNGIDGFSVADRVAWKGPIGAGGDGSHSLIGASYLTRIADNIGFNTAASITVNAEGKSGFRPLARGTEAHLRPLPEDSLGTDVALMTPSVPESATVRRMSGLPRERVWRRRRRNIGAGRRSRARSHGLSGRPGDHSKGRGLLRERSLMQGAFGGSGDAGRHVCGSKPPLGARSRIGSALWGR